MKVLFVLAVVFSSGVCFAAEGGVASTATANVPAQVHSSTLTYKLHNGPALIMNYVSAPPVSSSATVVSTAAVAVSTVSVPGSSRKTVPAKARSVKKAVKK